MAKAENWSSIIRPHTEDVGLLSEEKIELLRNVRILFRSHFIRAQREFLFGVSPKLESLQAVVNHCR